MEWILWIVLPLAGLTLGWIIRWQYARFQLTVSEQEAGRIKQDAIKEAEAKKKEILLEAKEQVIRERNQQEKETRERRAELQRYERRVGKECRSRWSPYH
jgi:ribonuclease Y